MIINISYYNNDNNNDNNINKNVINNKINRLIFECSLINNIDFKEGGLFKSIFSPFGIKTFAIIIRVTLIGL